MAFSERTYQALLVAYPQDHRQAYGESMLQLFRDRMHRDGGGFGTAVVWSQMGLDLASSATKERMETIMEVKSWTKHWWEALVVLFGVSLIAIGFLVMGDADTDPYSLSYGVIGPGVLLFAGLALRRPQRAVATGMIILGCLLPAAVVWWLVYPPVVGLVIVLGGFASGKIGFQGSGPEIAA
jgi:hypothetical protein